MKKFLLLVIGLGFVFWAGTGHGIYLDQRNEPVTVVIPEKGQISHNWTYCRYFRLPELFVEERWLAGGVGANVQVIGPGGKTSDPERILGPEGCPANWLRWKQV